MRALRADARRAAHISFGLIACVLVLGACAACAAPTAPEPVAGGAAAQEAPAAAPKGAGAAGAGAGDGAGAGADDADAAGAAAITNAFFVIDGRSFALDFAEGDAPRAFAAQFPLELALRDVNGNEKFATLDAPLPADDFAPGRVEAGEVMAYGGDGVVVFYESFDTPYRYTRLGRVSDPAALELLSVANSVRVTFEVRAD